MNTARAVEYVLTNAQLKQSQCIGRQNKMAQMIIDTANHIAGYAAKAARVKVVAAYPITPQTTIVEK